MRSLVRVKCDTSVPGHLALYLSYVEPRNVARTIEMTQTCSVAIDVDEHGTVQGIELIDPKNSDFEVLARVAREHDLSLEGI